MEEVIATAWEMENASEVLERSKLSRVEISEKVLQSQTKVVGTLKLDHVSPMPPNQCWKMSRFFQQKGKKNHLIIDIVSGGRENLLGVPTFLSGIDNPGQK